jgi:copper homeostasis protein
MLIEACVETVASAMAAERGGAGRLELCASLCDAGTTPSAGTIAAVKARVAIPVFVIVRPRGGGFVYSDSELDVMRRDIEAARRLGADGLVIGTLGGDGRVDKRRTRTLVDEAGGLPVTFHRAFDFTPDQGDALEVLIACGVQRVLTSGGAATAIEGAGRIAALVAQAAGRIGVVAGGGIREESVQDLVRRSGVTEIHVRGTRLARCAVVRETPVRLRKPLPDEEGAWEETDEARIRALTTLARV